MCHCDIARDPKADDCCHTLAASVAQFNLVVLFVDREVGSWDTINANRLLLRSGAYLFAAVESINGIEDGNGQ